MMKVTRIFLGVVLLGSVLGFGYAARSPWVIVPLAVIFALSFALGRWRGWRIAWNTGGIAAAIRAQGSTILAQAVVVAVLYLLGRGVGALVGSAPATAAFDGSDRMMLLGLAIVAICGGAGLALAEARMPNPASSESVARPAAKVFDPAEFRPVTEETFFADHHYSNIDRSVKDVRTPDPALAFLTEAQISEAETRLGIVLPSLLRRLYLRQNGGSLDQLVAPRVENPSGAEEDWVFPFSGYDDMNPLRAVRTVKDSVEDYADFDEQPEMFPTGADRMFVLAQWYRHTLFLDYRGGSIPRVGIFDFDLSDDLRDPEWQTRTIWWPDFDTFFASLRRPPEGWLE